MDNIPNLIIDLRSSDDKIRMAALNVVLELTNEPVNWIYDVWDDLFAMLNDTNSFKRSIGIMVLCNLAKSDTEDRLAHSLPRLLAHTRDAKFVTSRQCILHIWKAGVTNKEHKATVIAHLKERYKDCLEEGHYNLYRQDSIQALKHLSEATNDLSILEMIQELIALETDPKYRKKYETILKSSF